MKAVKYYPAGATTNSDSGVTDIRKCDAVLEAMAAHGLPLLLHGEVTDPEVDVFDREKVFIDTRAAAAGAPLPEAAHGARAHHDARGGALRVERARRTSRPRSPRTTCS